MARPREIVFIDGTVDAIDALLLGLRPEVEAVVLSTSERATSQIARALRDQEEIEAVHIIAHGCPGEVNFGAGPLSLESIGESAADLRLVGKAIGEGGNIALWTCAAGQGERGTAFVKALAQVTGLHVAAATGPVGSTALGGGWELDITSGGKTFAAPLTSQGMAAYQAVMATKTWTGGATTSKPNSSKWGTAAGWSPAGVPAAGDNVIIDGSGKYPVTLDVNTAGLNSLTINNSTATLTMTGTAASAINLQGANIIIGGGTGTINDAGGIALASGSSVSGAGKLNISGHYTGTGTLLASGGTLDIYGTIDNGVVLQIASGVLKIEGTATSAAAITINSGNETLEIGANGNVTINAAESITKGQIQLDGGILTDISGTGIAISNGASLTGKGTVAGTVAAPLSGSGTIKAGGGTLDLKTTVSSGPSLQIDTTAGSDLKIDGTATAAGAIAINNANQTLEIGSGGALTINAAETITNGRIQLGGGALKDVSGISVGSGAHLTGFGAVTAGTAAATDVDGTGNVTATGVTLEFKTLVDGTAASAFDIANVAGSVLKFDAAVGTTAINPMIAFDGATGTLDLTAITLANFHGIVANFEGGDQIKVANATSAKIDATGKILTVFNGSAVLGTLTLSTSHAGDTFTVSGGVITMAGLPSAATSGGEPAANGTWSVLVPQAAVAALMNGQTYTVNVSARDKAGNAASLVPPAMVTVDETATLAVNPIDGNQCCQCRQ
jgi:hypothetical protein